MCAMRIICLVFLLVVVCFGGEFLEGKVFFNVYVVKVVNLDYDFFLNVLFFWIYVIGLGVDSSKIYEVVFGCVFIMDSIFFGLGI